MNLSPHFTLAELVASTTAVRLAIDNTPSPLIVANLSVLAAGLELVRALLDAPMTIDSGYRCPALNTAVHGAHDSAHLNGFAADFLCPAFGDPVEICQAIRDGGINFDQVIQEGTWTHISFAPTMRQEVLTAYFDTNGHASYVPGLERTINA